jgi:hypothetical protein
MKGKHNAALALLFVVTASMPIKAATTPSEYVKGTHQMAGAQLKFGQVYSYNNNGSLINIAILKAEYVPGQFCPDNRSSYMDTIDHKILVIHFRVKNPNSGDLYLGLGKMFQGIDADGNTIDDVGTVRRLSEKGGIDVTLKPGQGVDDLVSEMVVPAQGGISKLVLQFGRAGTSDQVTRFIIGTAPNVIAPLPAPYADPADKTGASELLKIPATVGTTYMAGAADMTVNSLSMAPGPLGNHTPDDGKQFVVANVSIANKLILQYYFSDGIHATVTTDDDKITDSFMLKADHDDDFEGRMMDPDDTAAFRLVLQVPKDATLKTIALNYNMGNDGITPDFVYDLANVH